MSTWIQNFNKNGFQSGKIYNIDDPCQAVMASGIGGDRYYSVLICKDNNIDKIMNVVSKPEYKIPSMDEIRSIPWNGFNVVSLFSGCGGSCLGYRMAGYHVLYANEFVPIARKSYIANHDSALDSRDVKNVTAQDILDVTKMKKGEIDILDGSPPCQAFSTAGQRHKGWGKEKKYDHGAKQCNENLFNEYIRILRDLQPKCFIAENVSGLVKGTAKGFFLEILAGLKSCGYNVKAKVLDAQWLGVPQSRQRLIFIGVRNDLILDPVFPEPLTYNYSVRDALPWIDKLEFNGKGFGAKNLNGNQSMKPSPSVLASIQSPWYEYEVDISRYSVGKEYDKLKEGEQSKKYFSCIRADSNKPSPTILSSSGENASKAQALHPTEKRKFRINEIKRICSFPDDFILIGSYAKQWERLGNSVPPLMMKAISGTVRDKILMKISK